LCIELLYSRNSNYNKLTLVIGKESISEHRTILTSKLCFLNQLNYLKQLRSVVTAKYILKPLNANFTCTLPRINNSDRNLKSK